MEGPPGSIFIEDLGGPPEVQRLLEVFSRFFELPTRKIDDLDASRRFIVMRISAEPSGDAIRLTFYEMPGNVEVGPRIRFSHAVWEI